MRAILACLLLAACAASPSPTMWGAQSRQVTLQGRAYTVYWTDKTFEVVRLGWASPGQHQAIRASMLGLVPQVTGCRIPDGGATGDSGEIHGRLICP
jgi:hypothetical protein